MAEIIRMPRLSDTMEEGNIVAWLKKEGDAVSVGDILAEVETDKATMELESFYEGTLIYVGVKEGPVAVDGIIAIIGKKGENVKELLAEAEASSPQAEPEAKVENEPSPAPQSKPVPVAAPTPKSAPAVVSAPASSNGTSRVKASPLAKVLAEQKGIALNQVIGTGEGGRIIKRDIENYVPASSVGTAVEQAEVLQDFQYGDVSVSQMRKTIARRLSESKFGAPHFYLTIEINMGAAVKARKAINELAPPKVSFNDLVVKAAATALRKNPAVNSSWHGDRITYHQEINIGVAVAVDDGLVVPVIRNADMKSLSGIGSEVRALAGKARSKKITPTEMQGNTFTISNLGMFGIEEFTAIINPPDACIMAVGSIIDKAIVVDGQVVPGKMMKVTLSCDHRVVDGATGAQFLQSFKDLLENPVRMLV